MMDLHCKITTISRCVLKFLSVFFVVKINENK